MVLDVLGYTVDFEFWLVDLDGGVCAADCVDLAGLDVSGEKRPLADVHAESDL